MALLQSVIDRLKTQVTALKAVGGAGEVEAALQDVAIVPAAYVMLWSEKPYSNALVNATSQKVEMRLRVIVGVENHCEVTLKSGVNDLETIKDAVIAAVLNWSPETGYDPCDYAGGQIYQLINPRLWWQMEFITAKYIRAI